MEVRKEETNVVGEQSVIETVAVKFKSKREKKEYPVILDETEESLVKTMHLRQAEDAGKIRAEFILEQYPNRDYTVSMVYDKKNKVARFGIAIVHPTLDKFQRKEGRTRAVEKATTEPFLSVDVAPMLTSVTDKKQEFSIVNKVFRTVTLFLVPEVFEKVFLKYHK